MAARSTSSKISLVLGVDPGKYDTGWALYLRGKGLQSSGVIEGLDSADAYTITQCRIRLARLLKLYRPEAVAIERYHAQPRGAKTTLETQNLQIGMLIEMCIRKKIPWHLITPSTHKRWLSANYEVGVAVVKGRRRSKTIKKVYDIRTYEEWRSLRTEHEVDAANVAKYCLCKLYPPTT